MVCGYLISFSTVLNVEVVPVSCAAVRSRGCVALVVGCGVALLLGCGVALLPARPVDLRARGEGVVEYPGKVACPSGRRCSTRNAVWCHSHPGFKSQRYRHCRPAPLGPGGFVMPTRRAWVACDAAGGPGCFVCPWAAARPQCLVCGPAGVPGAGGPGCGAGLLGVPVGGGPPASRPRRELRSARRLVVRPGPATAHGHRSQAPHGPPAPFTPVGPGVLTCGLARRLVVRAGPDAARGHRSLSPT